MFSALVSTAIAAAVLVWTWHTPAGDQGDDETQLGAMLTQTLAASSIEPILAGDRIHLGVLVNRLRQVDRVAGAAIYTVDNQMLALGGELTHGSEYSAPVTQDDTVIGFVRVSLQEVPISALWTRVLISLACILLVPLATVLCVTRLAADMAARRAAATAADDFEEHADPDPGAFIEETEFLVLANLYNHFSLTPETRDLVLERTLTLAARISRLYSGEAAIVPGKGVLLSFTETGTDATCQQRAFEATSAAFLLAGVLRREERLGEYRLGAHCLHKRWGVRGETVSVRLAIEDAALLAAIAVEGTLVASREFRDRLKSDVRLDITDLSNPVLEHLRTAAGEACAIALIDTRQLALLERQAALLFNSADQDSASSESTF
ncbi:MAG: hypothetical protein QF921_06795 [Pseudomonadales bacterium]|jgi:uncharacterized membrane protein affecting hemolysin expression|nr:hypothetical protein [Pseudomonadales bacterium]MDP6469545.1 hypothetical protein [Pseudomonadales bacterium]MDP6827386.1 hypothetical protein [Pseudomonadales bacterium]MDP6971209.1 hypothetical protein [Pseudomonadales bacterium]